MNSIIIRNETPADYATVESMTRNAFWNVYCPGACEHDLLHVMRGCEDFISELDFVVEIDGRIVGNVVFVKSHIRLDNGEKMYVLSMGPLAVDPKYQHRGIGRALVSHVIKAASQLPYPAILLCGDPNLYSKYGFEQAEKYGIRTADNYLFPALHIYWLTKDIPAVGGRYIENSIYDVKESDVEEYDKAFAIKEKLSGTPSQQRFDEVVALARPYLKIEEYSGDRTNLMDLLLIGDESEKQVLSYIGNGRLFVGRLNDEIIAVALVIEVDPQTLEIKNLAIHPTHHHNGFGRMMLQFIGNEYGDKRIILGTGEVPSTMGFYEACGFSYSHRIPNFFIDNYPNPIIEDGMQLRDMVYLAKNPEVQ